MTAHPIGPLPYPDRREEPAAFAIWQALTHVRNAWDWADVARQVEASLRERGIVDPARRSAYCNDCGVSVPVVEEGDEEIGYEEQARVVHVIKLDCGHDLVCETRRV